MLFVYCMKGLCMISDYRPLNQYVWTLGNMCNIFWVKKFTDMTFVTTKDVDNDIVG